MAKLFLSELKIMLGVVERQLTDIDNRTSEDAWGKKYTEKDRERRVILLKRKRELEDKIIQYVP